MPDLVLLDVADNIATVTVNRPERGNSLSIELLAELRTVLREIDARSDVRVVIFRGAEGKNFSSGFDFTQILTTDSDVFDDSKPVTKSDDGIDATMSLVAACHAPTIAMVQGMAVGTGCELAATCDLRLAATGAVFGMPPARLGILYSQAAIGMYLNLLGPAATKEIFFSGRRLKADRALAIGLVNAVFPEDQLEDQVYGLAREIAANAPLAVQGTKRIIQQLRPARGPEVPTPEMQALLDGAWGSADLREGVKSLLEKRRPVYQGR
ncbi:MAG: enoyl-CoA hydratase/isomerase family protein [Chloroflexi bacterium]|nr:enoyl-CoA hydratase/isomerase family protein [Chloroflexota bacterium]